MREPMQDVAGVPCDNPIEGAELVASLDWYDGVMMAAILRTGEGLWFRVWDDMDGRVERWLVAKTTRERVEALGDGMIVLSDMLREPTDGRLIVLDCDGERTARCVVANDRAAVVDDSVGDVPFRRDEWRTQPVWRDDEIA